MKKSLVISIVLIMVLAACSRESNTAKEKTITVTSRAVSHDLFYAGIIHPFKTVVVPSPVEGVVIETAFQYGESVKAGQLLFKISSTKFMSEFKEALLQFVKSKSEFHNTQTQLNEATFLHKHQLISDDDFKMKQSGFYTARLALLQSRDALENLLRQMNIKKVNLDELTIADIDKISTVMHGQLNADSLSIVAPVDGIVLGQHKTTEESTKTRKGDAIKQGDVLAVIGDMHGMTVDIKVNELTLNQLKLGQVVKVTGLAFPDERLTGTIVRMDKQGDVSGNGLPTFNVQVSVDKLSDTQQKNIHVGMSAKIAMNLQEEARITVPMVAVKEKNGKAFVHVWDEKNRKSREVTVQTGKSTPDTIAILAGLHSGDKIVLID